MYENMKCYKAEYDDTDIVTFFAFNNSEAKMIANNWFGNNSKVLSLCHVKSEVKMFDVIEKII